MRGVSQVHPPVTRCTGTPVTVGGTRAGVRDSKEEGPRGGTERVLVDGPDPPPPRV